MNNGQVVFASCRVAKRTASKKPINAHDATDATDAGAKTALLIAPFSWLCQSKVDYDEREQKKKKKKSDDVR